MSCLVHISQSAHYNGYIEAPPDEVHGGLHYAVFRCDAGYDDVVSGCILDGYSARIYSLIAGVLLLLRIAPFEVHIVLLGVDIVVEDIFIERLVDLCPSGPLNAVSRPYAPILLERAVVGGVGVANIQDIEFGVDVHVFDCGFDSLFPFPESFVEEMRLEVEKMLERYRPPKVANRVRGGVA